MNKHLDKAIFNIGKVDALMHSIEQLYLDFEVMPEEQEKLDRGAYAFYALWDEIRAVADELDLLSGDCRVVDAIYAANGAQKRQSTLTNENC